MQDDSIVGEKKLLEVLHGLLLPLRFFHDVAWLKLVSLPSIGWRVLLILCTETLLI